MRSPRFWQALLSLDLLPHQARALLERLGPDCVEPEDLIRSHAITNDQKTKLENALAKLDSISDWPHILSVEHDDYPSNLRTANPPAALMVLGKIEPRDSLAVSIVGTRKASIYGAAVARRIAYELASAGITIISGGAYGIDAAAHEGALEAGGRTIAVLGSGLDKLYPASHKHVFEKISRNGAVISQFALGKTSQPWMFPIRNDTIAGLSRAVIVVEAPSMSGALITAASAAEYGRLVFATPANIDSLNYRGSFRLINDGATLLFTPDQVFEALGVNKRVGARPQIELSETHAAILALLSSEPEIPDNLSEKLQLPAGEMFAHLTELELRGLISKTPGGYVKA